MDLSCSKDRSRLLPILAAPRIYISSRKSVRSTISRLWLAFLDFWEVLAALAATRAKNIGRVART